MLFQFSTHSSISLFVYENKSEKEDVLRVHHFLSTLEKASLPKQKNQSIRMRKELKYLIYRVIRTFYLDLYTLKLLFKNELASRSELQNCYLRTYTELFSYFSDSYQVHNHSSFPEARQMHLYLPNQPTNHAERIELQLNYKLKIK